MKKVKSLLFVNLACVLLLSSCGKYDKGPWVSFLSEEKRLCRTWFLEKIDHSNGYSTTDFYWKLTFNKDKTLNIDHKTNSGITIPTNSNWDWFLVDYGLKINSASMPQGLPSGERLYEIKRLTQKELWIEDRGSLINYHFKSE
jgi:hypothetical protein